MRTKILEGFQPASIYYRSRWDGHGIRLYYICCLLHLPIRYQALPAVRGRDRPARLRVWAGTRAPVTQTPPVSQWALCIQHPLNDSKKCYLLQQLHWNFVGATGKLSTIRFSWSWVTYQFFKLWSITGINLFVSLASIFLPSFPSGGTCTSLTFTTTRKTVHPPGLGSLLWVKFLE